jgi:hypothetical protein
MRRSTELCLSLQLVFPAQTLSKPGALAPKKKRFMASAPEKSGVLGGSIQDGQQNNPLVLLVVRLNPGMVSNLSAMIVVVVLILGSSWCQGYKTFFICHCRIR